MVQMTDALNFGDVGRLKPISDCWGFDRGQPIDRFYIEDFLNKHASSIAGTVLEIGDPLYTTMFGGDRVLAGEVLDVNKGPFVTYQGDLETDHGCDSVPSNRFDCLVVTQTLQFIYNVKAAVQIFHRVLKPDGVLLATVPGVTRTSESEYPSSWFWSFTRTSTARMFGEVFGHAAVGVRTYGNVLAAACFLYGLAAEELSLEQLGADDPDFPVVVAVRAVKS
jgi:SAM-dependent methyltransferase